MNGSETGCDGSWSDASVPLTVSSCDLLNVESSGRVDMDSKCFPMILRLSMGVSGGGEAGLGDVNVGSGWNVDGVVWCQAVHMT